MNRVAVFIVLTILLAACAQSVVTFPVAAPGPTTSPVISPTPAAPSATAVPFSTATVTATPSCLPIRIMPLGDSITYGEGVVSYGGYRNLLGALLESEGVQFDYVGSRKSGTESLADPDNEGHPGWTISKLHEELFSEGWLETYRPDIILLHIGTNDFPHAGPNQEQVNLMYLRGELSALLDDILLRLPETHVIVAQIIRTRWGSDTNHILYNAAIPDIVASKDERVSVVNMEDILIRGDFVSLYHPSPRGYDKMAHAWNAAIMALGLECSASR